MCHLVRLHANQVGHMIALYSFYFIYLLIFIIYLFYFLSLIIWTDYFLVMLLTLEFVMMCDF